VRMGDEFPQIPWATETRVKYVDGYAVITRGSVEVQVHNDGDIWYSRNSEADIKDHMELDQRLTWDLRAWMEECPHVDDARCVRLWLAGESAPVPEGVKEWRPPVIKRPPWEIFEWGQGDSSGHEGWMGDPFWYTHFLADDGREGLVVRWRGRDLEVWIGDASYFLLRQLEQEPWEAGTIREYNETLENGILWALDHYGLFDKEPDKLKPGVLELLEHDPDLMWGELVEKLIPVANTLPTELQQALRVWLTRRRIEAERRLRQKYLWPRLYPEKIWEVPGAQGR